MRSHVLPGASLDIVDVSLPGDIHIDGTDFTVRSNFTTSLEGVISGSGKVTKEGTGSLTLSGPNTYTGGTRVFDGTLLVGASESIPDSSSLFLAGGTVFDLNGHNETTGARAVYRAVRCCWAVAHSRLGPEI